MSEDKREPKYMDAQEFLDSGLLQEANRLFFHPIGLALSCRVCSHKKTETDEAHKTEDCPWPGTTYYGIYDYREDPEGMFYDFGPNGEDIPDATRKYLNVSQMFYDRIEARAKFAAEEKIPMTANTVLCAQDLKYNV